MVMLKRAKFAASYAFVSEINISVYDKGDILFTGLGAQKIGQAEETQRLRPKFFQLILRGTNIINNICIYFY